MRPEQSGNETKYYRLHAIVTPRREIKVVSSFPTRVISDNFRKTQNNFHFAARRNDRMQMVIMQTNINNPNNRQPFLHK